MATSKLSLQVEAQLDALRQRAQLLRDNAKATEELAQASRALTAAEQARINQEQRGGRAGPGPGPGPSSSERPAPGDAATAMGAPPDAVDPLRAEARREHYQREEDRRRAQEERQESRIDGSGGVRPPGGGSQVPVRPPAPQAYPAPQAPPRPGGMASSMMSRGRGMLNTAVGTALGMGLGSGVMGFITSSAATFMQVDSIVARMGRRFRETSEDVTLYGQALGYTRAQSAGIAEALGGAENVISRGTFARYAGFARDSGLDAPSTARQLGMIRMLTGREQNQEMLAAYRQRAGAFGMGQGRFEEFLGTLQGLTQQMMSATGGASYAGVASQLGLLQSVFSDGRGGVTEAGRGERGASFLSNVHNMLTQKGGAMETTLMRAIGYGSDPNLGYIDMRKRIEAGVSDPRNLGALFGYFQDRGMGHEARFRALEGNSNMPAWQIDALSRVLGDPETLRQYVSMADEDPAAAAELFRSKLSAEDRARYDQSGFAGLGGGKGRIGMGDIRARQMEALHMKVGGPVADTMIRLSGSADKMITAIDRFSDGALTGALDRLITAIDTMAEKTEQASRYAPNLHDTVSSAAPYLSGVGPLGDLASIYMMASAVGDQDTVDRIIRAIREHAPSDRVLEAGWNRVGGNP